MSQGDYKNYRLGHLKEKVVKFDVVLLQEMFELGGRQGSLIHYARAHGLPYHAGPVRPKIASKQLIDSGLLILSRYPIVQRDFLRFTRKMGADGLCSKGALYAKLQVAPDAYLHVFTTHTQSGESREYDP